MNVDTILNILIILVIIFIIVWLIYGKKNKEFFLNAKVYDNETCLNDPMIDTLKLKVELFLQENKGKFKGELTSLNSDINMVSKLQICLGESSFTINKEATYLCVKDKKTNNYYPEGMLMHVLLHELSHVICSEIGHTAKFDKIFNELMIEAEKAGIYDTKQVLIKDYCGLTEKDTYTIDEFQVKKTI